MRAADAFLLGLIIVEQEVRSVLTTMPRAELASDVDAAGESARRALAPQLLLRGVVEAQVGLLGSAGVNDALAIDVVVVARVNTAKARLRVRVPVQDGEIRGIASVTLALLDHQGIRAHPSEQH